MKKGHFWEKGALPAIDTNGKVLLESHSKVFMAPNGNGAVYEALVVNGCLKYMSLPIFLPIFSLFYSLFSHY